MTARDGIILNPHKRIAPENLKTLSPKIVDISFFTGSMDLFMKIAYIVSL